MSAHPVRWIGSSLFKLAVTLGCIVAMIVGLGVAQRQRLAWQHDFGQIV